MNIDLKVVEDDCLSETAHDMLTKLGFKKIYNSELSADYEKYSEDYITRIFISKSEKEYRLSNYNKNNSIFTVLVDKPLHEALDQLMAEIEAQPND